MRLWSLHPKYLDTAGLTACWREALLARKVLTGQTKGYRNHPQLIRFRQCADPVGMADAYLLEIFREAERRGYRYDRTKIGIPCRTETIPVSSGQVRYETDHLQTKLAKRSPDRLTVIRDREEGLPELHPLFHLYEGDVEPWEMR